MSIGNRLDEAMKEAGYASQSALARASGVPQPTINRILSGDTPRGPESATVRKLAENGKHPNVVDAIVEAVVMPGTTELRSLDDPAPTAAAQPAPTTLADATTMTSPRQAGTVDAITTETAAESKTPLGDSAR